MASMVALANLKCQRSNSQRNWMHLEANSISWESVFRITNYLITCLAAAGAIFNAGTAFSISTCIARISARLQKERAGFASSLRLAERLTASRNSSRTQTCSPMYSISQCNSEDIPVRSNEQNEWNLPSWIVNGTIELIASTFAYLPSSTELLRTGNWPSNRRMEPQQQWSKLRSQHRRRNPFCSSLPFFTSTNAKGSNAKKLNNLLMLGQLKSDWSGGCSRMDLRTAWSKCLYCVEEKMPEFGLFPALETGNP